MGYLNLLAMYNWIPLMKLIHQLDQIQIEMNEFEYHYHEPKKKNEQYKLLIKI